MEALILEITTRGLHRYHQIGEAETTIGRALDNDIILSDPTVAPHHLKIVRHEDSIEIVNLAEVNPTRIGRELVDTRITRELPLSFEIGRVRAQLLPRDYPVPATRSLAGRDSKHVFGHPAWAVLLVAACLVLSGYEFYVQSYTDYKWTDLVKYVLSEAVLTIGSLVISLAVLERLLVNRWEIKQLVTSVCLVYLAYILLTELSDGLVYLVSASWPSTVFQFGWNLLLIPAAITLYLIHISHLRANRSIVLAVLIASPIAIPALLQSPELLSLLDDFSLVAPYQNSLSPANWHLAETVSIDSFIEQARQLDPGEFSD
jgi:hypothetical protein